MRRVYSPAGELDFAQLARRHPALARHLVRRAAGSPHPFSIRFKDPAALRELAYAILAVEYDLAVEFPLDTLVPPIPNRRCYVDFVRDLVAGKEDARGIDIGFGASCVFPLLACRLNPGWRFLGFDISERSFCIASDNVKRNQLQDRITLVLNKDPARLLAFSDDAATYDLTMCNPPFYEDADDVSTRDRGKRRRPSSARTGAANEIFVEGGEVAFVKRLIEESAELSDKIRWFTTMLGIKSSLKILKASLRERPNVTRVVDSVISAGRTRRWLLAWSFTEK